MNIRRYALFILVVLALAACGPDPREKSRTDLRMLDITNAKENKLYDGESFWTNGTPGILMKCEHWTEGASSYIEAGTKCVWFDAPKPLGTDPKLLAMNMGSWQKTTSVWRIADGSMMSCFHGRDTFVSRIDMDTEDCQAFEQPTLLEPGAILITMNAGTGQKSQTIWQYPDGRYAICTHDTESTGFLNLGGKIFKEAQSCADFPVPNQILEMDLKNPRLTGITSDDSSPPEVYWQDDEGYVVRCFHEWDGTWFNGGVGKVKSCGYWQPFWDNVVPEPPDVITVILTPEPYPVEPR